MLTFRWSNGLVRIKIPLCRTRGVDGGYLYEGGRPVGRGDPNNIVGPELIVAKEGYDTSITYRSNTNWKTEDTSRESPFVLYLTRTCTEPEGSANQSQPVHPHTNQTSAAAGSGR